MNVKDIVAKNPDCILYFGDNKALFLSALKDVGTSKNDIVAISHNAERELEANELPAHYVIVVKDGKRSEWNVINSETICSRVRIACLTNLDAAKHQQVCC